MREIKFRHYTGKKFIYSEQEGWEMWGDCIMAFDEPVQQYTGLKDKNGKEIYEGDIVTNRYNEPAKVVFKDCCYWLEWDEPCRYDHSCLTDSEGYLEVVGNIYENPKLLGEPKVYTCGCGESVQYTEEDQHNQNCTGGKE
jgi:hypothetical protein